VLSKGDVAAAVLVMKRFWPYIEADDIAVGAWHALFSRDIDDADILREAVLNACASGAEQEREVGHRILREAAEIIRARNDQAARELDEVWRTKVARAALAALGKTEAEWHESAAVRDSVNEWCQEHSHEIPRDAADPIPLPSGHDREGLL
jgi:hypothetical protein